MRRPFPQVLFGVALVGCTSASPSTDVDSSASSSSTSASSSTPGSATSTGLKSSTATSGTSTATSITTTAAGASSTDSLSNTSGATDEGSSVEPQTSTPASSNGTEAPSDSTNTSTSDSETTSDSQPTARATCPAQPPASTKEPAADRALAIAKDDYGPMIEQQPAFSGTRGSLPWHLYTPAQAEASPGERFPLLIVLHGGYGREVEDGNILVDVAQYLLGSANGLLTPANRETHPTFILLPHCRVDEGCNFGSNEWASTGGPNFRIQTEPSAAGGTALELIEHVVSSYPVDKRRVYITGNSMGGGGTWEFAARYPARFAAALPVSGHTPAASHLAAIASAKLPVWAFGAADDYTNPYTDTVAAIDALQNAGGCGWLTTYNNTGHDDALWSSPYLEPGLWSWLFAQTNSAAP